MSDSATTAIKSSRAQTDQDQSSRVEQDRRAASARRLRSARKLEGLSMHELAKRAGCSVQAICGYENASRSIRPDVALLLGKLLKVSPAYLLCLESSPTKRGQSGEAAAIAARLAAAPETVRDIVRYVLRKLA